MSSQLSPPPANQPVGGAMPANNMAIAVIGTVLGLCSCLGLILGIIAIVSANSVGTKWAAGDVAGANQAAGRAKILGVIAIVLGILGFIFSGWYYSRNGSFKI